MNILNGSSFSTSDIRAIATPVVAAELAPSDARRLTIVVRELPDGTSTDGKKRGIGRAEIGSIQDPLFRIWIDMPATPTRQQNADPVTFAHTIAHEIAHCRGLEHPAMAGDSHYDYSAGWRERYAWAAALPLRWQPEVRSLGGAALRFRGEVDAPSIAASGAATTSSTAGVGRMFDHLRSEVWDQLHARHRARLALESATSDTDVRTAAMRLAATYPAASDALTAFSVDLQIVDRQLHQEEEQLRHGRLNWSDRSLALRAEKRRLQAAVVAAGGTTAPPTVHAPARATVGETAQILRGRLEADLAVLHARRTELETELAASRTLVENLAVERSLDRKRIAELEAAQERTRLAFDQLRRLDQQRTDAYFGVRPQTINR